MSHGVRVGELDEITVSNSVFYVREEETLSKFCSI